MYFFNFHEQFGNKACPFDKTMGDWWFMNQIIFYYPIELITYSDWLRAGPFDVEWTGCKEKSKYGKKSAQSDNRLLRNCLVVPFVPSALEWTSLRSFHSAPTSVYFFPPKQLLSSIKSSILHSSL